MRLTASAKLENDIVTKNIYIIVICMRNGDKSMNTILYTKSYQWTFILNTFDDWTSQAKSYS